MQSIEKITREEFKNLSIIVMMGMCGMLGIDIHLASMPHIMRFMHTNKVHMQQSVSLFLLGMGVSLLFYGPLSDKYGRKPIVIMGLFIAVLSSFAAVFSTNIHSFLLIRLLQGVGSGVSIGLGRTIVADIVQGERLSVVGSYFSMFMTLSPLFAPALGGYIQHWFHWQANFVVLGALLSFVLIIYVLFCPETNQYKNPDACRPKSIFVNYKSLIFHSVFMGCTVITGIAMAANMTYATISPFLLQTQFHLGPIMYGWITAIAGLGGLVGQFINPMFVRRIGGQRTLGVGLLLIFSAGVWLILFITFQTINLPIIMIAVFTTIFGQSFISANSLSLALSTFRTKRGAAGALYGCFQMVVAFLVSAMVGSMLHNGAVVLGMSYFALGLLGMFIYIYIFKNKKSSHSMS